MKRVADQQRIPKLYYVKFLLLALGYGFNGTSFTAIPLLFYRAQLQCVDVNGLIYGCSNEEACENPFGFIEQTEYSQIKSLVSLLDLYCDRKIIEAFMLTFSQFGKVIAYAILILFPIKKVYKEFVIYSCFIISGTMLCLLSFFQTIEMFAIAFFVWNSLFSIFYGLIYNHISDAYPSSMSEYGSAYINTSWPGIMIVFIAFSYFFGSWQNILIHFTGIPLLLIGASSFYLKFYMTKSSQYVQFDNLIQEEQITHQKQSDQNSTEFQTVDSLSVIQNLKENYLAVKQNKDLRKNICIWTMCWTCNGLCYIGCYFQLNTLQGNLYLNNLSSTVFEVLASILAVVLVKRVNLLNIIVATYFIIGVAFTSCIFINTDLNVHQTASSLIMNLSPVIIAKVSYEVMWTILVKYQSTVFHQKYHQIQFSFSNMIGMLICNAIPFYKYFMETLNLSPFVGYGLFCLLASYYSTQFIQIGSSTKSSNLKKQLNKQDKFQSVELQDIHHINSY